jgi:uroporphyrinogen-III synthase
MPKENDPMDSESLFAAMPIPEWKGKSVLIIRGEHGREWLFEQLRNEGILVEQVASYRREAPVLDLGGAELLSSLLGQASDWVITSSEGLKNLVEMVVKQGGKGALAGLQRQSLWVPHARIAEKAKECGFQDITLTGSGDENLLAALQWHV